MSEYNLPYDYKDAVRRHLLFFLSGAWKDTQRFQSAFGEAGFRLTTYLRKPPPRIIQEYFDFGSGTINNFENWNTIKNYFINQNQVCLEIIRDFKNWQPKIVAYDRRELAEMQPLIGYIHLPNVQDKNSVDDIVETMKLVTGYPYVVAVQKSEVAYDWHKDYPILNSPDTLIYDLDDIESVANIYRALIRKMSISDEDKQGFLDCIDWQIENNDK